jgi:hypothetical protein
MRLNMQLPKKSLMLLLLTATPAAYAAVGGLDKANTLAQDIKTGAFALLGTGALIYLIYLAFMAFTEKKSWSDFGWGVVHVAVAGGVIALGNWAWTAFA